MDLMQRLKLETNCYHNRIEQTILLKKLLSQQITLFDYQILIEKFYGFIKPCEEIIKSLSCKILIENREKTPWLTQDLQALNIEITKLPSCLNLPDISQHDHILGYLYVMEGATLGGQFIAKMLYSLLQISSVNGGRYFHGHGDETKQRWRQFCSQLDSINDIRRQDIIINHAVETFCLFQEWIDKLKLTTQQGRKELVE